MTDKRDLGENWDRSEWAEEGTAPDAPEGATWSREQMEIDDDEDAEGAASRVREEGTPPSAGDSGLTGSGQPGGESHWERVDED